MFLILYIYECGLYIKYIACSYNTLVYGFVAIAVVTTLRQYSHGLLQCFSKELQWFQLLLELVFSGRVHSK